LAINIKTAEQICRLFLSRILVFAIHNLAFLYTFAVNKEFLGHYIAVVPSEDC